MPSLHQPTPEHTALDLPVTISKADLDHLNAIKDAAWEVKGTLYVLSDGRPMGMTSATFDSIVALVATLTEEIG